MPSASCAKRAARDGYGLAGAPDGRVSDADEGSPVAVPERTAGPPQQRRRVRVPDAEERWASLRPASAASRGIRWRRPRPLQPTTGSTGVGSAAGAGARAPRGRRTVRTPRGVGRAHHPSPTHHHLPSRAQAARRAVPGRSRRGSRRASRLLSRATHQHPPPWLYRPAEGAWRIGGGASGTTGRPRRRTPASSSMVPPSEAPTDHSRSERRIGARVRTSCTLSSRRREAHGRRSHRLGHPPARVR